MAALVFNSLSLLRQTLVAWQPFIRRHKFGLPRSKWHVVLSEKDIGQRPVFIVGDIHGCYDELQDLIAVAREAAKGAELFLVCVGDMLNKGPRNRDVLVFLQDLIGRGLAAAVKGNHEEAILRQQEAMCSDTHYELPQRYHYLREFSDDDFDFIKKLPYSISIPHLNVLAVHAGLMPGVPLQDQTAEDLCQIRNVHTTVSYPWGALNSSHRKPTDGVAWASTWRGPQHVYFGHDCRRGLQQLPLATGLDTGCVYGQTLTGALLERGEGKPRLLSVPARCQHYLGKKNIAV